MGRLLYITANPKGIEKSKGLQIGETFLQAFLDQSPHTDITKIDLFSDTFPQMDADLVSARGKMGGYGMTYDELEPAEREKILRMHALAEDFVNYDYYVFVSPVWNLGSPAVLKAFIDNLFVAGKTFTFTSEGPKGLLTGKKGLHIQTRGGIYSYGPMKELESGDRYLQIAMNFLGIDMMETVFAEGLDHYPDKVPVIVAKAKEDAANAASLMAAHEAALQ